METNKDECTHDYENAVHIKGTFLWECPLCGVDISIGYVLYHEAVQRNSTNLVDTDY